jgi:tetratricopeptide (TPR) repeat protein
MTAVRCVAALALVAVVLAAAPATADPDAPNRRAQALVLYALSREHYQAGRYREAADLLREAYRIFPEPILQYNLGRALEGLGRLNEAAAAYEAYAAAAPQAPDRGPVLLRAAELRRRAQAGATSRPAGSQPGEGAPAWPPAGGDHSHRARGSLLGPALVGGGGALMLAGGAVVGVLALGKQSEARRAPAQTTTSALLATGRREALVANVLFIAGGVATAVGLGWGSLAWRRGHEAHGPSGRDVALVLVPCGAGAALVGAF